MKTIYTLSTLILLAMSVHTQADDKVKGNNKPVAVSAAPFSLGDPDGEVPAWLGHVKAKNALVPLAPFVWGTAEEVEKMSELRLAVPVAPFAYGEPDRDVPYGLQYVKAVNADVPLAPFEFGEPEAEAPEIVSSAR